MKAGKTPYFISPLHHRDQIESELGKMMFAPRYKRAKV